MDATTHNALVGGGVELTLAECALIDAKSRANRLGFAVMLLFFRDHGRFPRASAEGDVEMVADLARRLDISAPTAGEVFPFGVAERTLERQRAELRALFGFRQATVADAEELVAWSRDHTVAQTRDLGQLTAMLEERCRALAIEPPTLDRIERLVRAAVRAYEDRFAAAIHGPPS